MQNIVSVTTTMRVALRITLQRETSVLVVIEFSHYQVSLRGAGKVIAEPFFLSKGGRILAIDVTNSFKKGNRVSSGNILGTSPQFM